MKEKTCTFIGHGELWGAPKELEDRVREAIERLITEKEVDTFLCGGMGGFDALCASVTRRVKLKYPNIKLRLILPYLTKTFLKNAKYYEQEYDEISCPLVLARANYKAAIPLRNRWMIDESAYAVCYVKESYGGARQSYRYAQRRGISLFNFASE